MENVANRSIWNMEIKFSRLASFISANHKAGRPYLVGIDGMSAVGKSTFSERLGQAMAAENLAYSIIPMDDLFSIELHQQEKDSLYPGFDMEWIRSEIISPLKDGKTVKFRRYDKISKSMAEVLEISGNTIIIIEGIFTTGRLLGDYLDLRIWLDCPRETVLERGEIRSGEMRSDWEGKWLPAEDAYITREASSMTSDLTVDSTWQEKEGMFISTITRNPGLADWLKS